MRKIGTNKENNLSVSFARAIEELEEIFIQSNQGELYRFVLTAVEKPLIKKVLEKTEGNQLKAARILGINRNTLRSHIRKLGITVIK